MVNFFTNVLIEKFVENTLPFVTSQSVLNLCTIPPAKFLEVMIAWINKYMVQMAMQEIGVSKPTICKLYNSFFKIIRLWLEETSEKIGSVGHTVEIDESAFGKRKNNKGRVHKVRWVVGGIDRDTKKTFLVHVEKRDQVTLNDVIKKYVFPGTTVYTGEWRGYHGIENYSYVHKTVNHSKNFVNPNTQAHTQNIEGY